jgi:ferrous iron transport protein B
MKHEKKDKRPELSKLGHILEIPKKPILVLAGNPNIGKSVIFNGLTGIGVTVSNYPGTTVEFTEGTSKYTNIEMEVIDLPGIYSLGSDSLDQMVARNKILELKNKAIIINVIDASNLERNLIFTLELFELEIPFIVCLNMVDEAQKRGIKINYDNLKEILGLPVIPTIATQGKGIDKLVESALNIFNNKIKPKPMKFRFGKDIEVKINRLENILIEKEIDRELNISTRAIAIRLIEKDVFFIDYFKRVFPEILVVVEQVCKEIEEEHGESSSVRIAKERNAIATNIADLVKEQIESKPLLKDKIDALTTKVSTGIPIMIGVWIGLLSILIFGGGLLEGLFINFWEVFINQPITNALTFLAIDPAIKTIFITGTLLGIQATLSIILPYAGIFYILLAILEDTGYLTRMAFLMDSIMHKLGLHGKSIIPLIAGFGCSVPAIMGTRILESKREKIIATFLIVLIPCAARTSIILGVVGANIGFLPVLGIYGVIIIIVLISGFILNKILKGEKTGLVIEMPPYRIPKTANILKKTWFRLKDFIIIAIPIIVLGSITLGALSYFNILNSITFFLAPLITGVLGLPAITGVVLFFGFLRKELALAMLISILGTADLLLVLTPVNLIVFSLVISLYIPCIAAFATIRHELGLESALLISLGTILLAFAIGGLANLILTPIII